MIRPLPVEVRSHLRSGVTVTSVSQGVEELLLNSLDAGATCVALRVDLSCLRVQVVDNGSGIPRDQLELLGDRYATSKCHSLSDLEQLCYYGYRGEAVASLREACGVLEVVTRARGSSHTFCKMFQNGKALSVTESSTPRPSVGTTITVHDLFQNFPVRRKSINEHLELERIKQRVEGLALFRPGVSISLRNDATGSIILQTHKCVNIVTTFSHLFGAARAQTLVEVSGTKGPVIVEGYLGTEAHSKKSLQYVYINGRLVLKTRIHKLVNQCMSKSSICRKKSGYTVIPDVSNKQQTVSSPAKFTDRYPVYLLNVKSPFTDYDITFDPAKTLVEFKDWDIVLECISEIIASFLKKEKLEVSQEENQNGSEGQVHTAKKTSETQVNNIQTISPSSMKDTLLSKKAKKQINKFDPFKTPKSLSVEEWKKLNKTETVGHETMTEVSLGDTQHDIHVMDEIECSDDPSVGSDSTPSDSGQKEMKISQPTVIESKKETFKESNPYKTPQSMSVQEWKKMNESRTKKRATVNDLTQTSCLEGVKHQHDESKIGVPLISNNEVSESNCVDVKCRDNYLGKVRESSLSAFKKLVGMTHKQEQGERRFSSSLQKFRKNTNLKNLRYHDISNKSKSLVEVPYTGHRAKSSKNPLEKTLHSDIARGSAGLASSASEKSARKRSSDPDPPDLLTASKLSRLVRQNTGAVTISPTTSKVTSSFTSRSDEVGSYSDRQDGEIDKHPQEVDKNNLKFIPSSKHTEYYNQSSGSTTIQEDNKISQYIETDITIPKLDKCHESPVLSPRIPREERTNDTSGESSTSTCKTVGHQLVESDSSCSDTGETATENSRMIISSCTEDLGDSNNPVPASQGFSPTAVDSSLCEKQLDESKTQGFIPGVGASPEFDGEENKFSSQESFGFTPRSQSTFAEDCTQSITDTIIPVTLVDRTENLIQDDVIDSEVLSDDRLKESNIGLPRNMKETAKPEDVVKSCDEIASLSPLIDLECSGKNIETIKDMETSEKVENFASKEKVPSDFSTCESSITVTQLLNSSARDSCAPIAAACVRKGFTFSQIFTPSQSDIEDRDLTDRKESSSCSLWDSSLDIEYTDMGSQLQGCEGITGSVQSPADDGNESVDHGTKKDKEVNLVAVSDINIDDGRLQEEKQSKNKADNPAGVFERRDTDLTKATVKEQDIATTDSGVSGEDLWIHTLDPATGSKICIQRRTGMTMSSEQWRTHQACLPEPESSPVTEEGTSHNAQDIVFRSAQGLHDTDLRIQEFPHVAMRVRMDGPTAGMETGEERSDSEEDADDDITVKWRDQAGARSIEDSSSDWTLEALQLNQEKDVVDPEAGEASSSCGLRLLGATHSCRFTRDMLDTVKVVGQLDNKFITCLMDVGDASTAGEDLLIVVDQHAAHERVRLEMLTQEAYVDYDVEGGQLRPYDVDPPKCMVFTEEEIRVMWAYKEEILRIGIRFSQESGARETVLIHSVPACLVDREPADVRRRRTHIYWTTIQTLVKEHIELLLSTQGATGRFPTVIHKVLCSQACHGAIKFGDPLTTAECTGLVRDLAQCELPFQCAHGRPAVMPLLNLQQLHTKLPTQKQSKPKLYKLACGRNEER